MPKRSSAVLRSIFGQPSDLVIIRYRGCERWLAIDTTKLVDDHRKPRDGIGAGGEPQ
jgi:hypothetical protein